MYNLKRTRELVGLGSTVLARKLFPEHLHPYQALYYAETGKRELKESELNTLHELCGFYPDTVQTLWRITPLSNNIAEKGYIINVHDEMLTILSADGNIVCRTSLPYDLKASQLYQFINKKIEENESND